MTGLAIVLYLNQTPGQPRERDYAYAGSFYAFAIWIGMGVAGCCDMLRRKQAKILPVGLLMLLCLFVPIQMASQTWDDHDRSNRYTCRDFGANYLMTLPDKEIRSYSVTGIMIRSPCGIIRIRKKYAEMYVSAI